MARAHAVAPSIRMRVRTSREAIEALRLEIRRLAGRLGVPAATVRIRHVDGRQR